MKPQTLHLISSVIVIFSTIAKGDEPPLDEVSIPKVPAAVLKSQVMPSTVEAVEVRPGMNTVIPVAMGHLNRLLLPFENPKIRTVDTATTEINGRVLYVAPSNESPLSLYVTEGDNEEVALSLTLAPGAMAPREIRLRMMGRETKSMPRTKVVDESPIQTHASMGNSAETYLSRVKQLLKTVAQGQTPEGYLLRSPDKHEQIRCSLKPLKISTGQVLEGGAFKILVGAVKNSSNTDLEVLESACSKTSPATLAIAAWPKTMLTPGESTELYVLIKTQNAEERPGRPRLIKASSP